MGFRKLLKDLATSVEDMERERLSSRFDAGDSADTTPIASVSPRQPVKVVGEVTAVRVVPRSGSPWLEVTLDDGTGTLIAIFTGRRRIQGMEPGRAMLIDGVARLDRNRALVMNPAYTLLA